MGVTGTMLVTEVVRGRHLGVLRSFDVEGGGQEDKLIRDKVCLSAPWSLVFKNEGKLVIYNPNYILYMICIP